MTHRQSSLSRAVGAFFSTMLAFTGCYLTGEKPVCQTSRADCPTGFVCSRSTGKCVDRASFNNGTSTGPEDSTSTETASSSTGGPATSSTTSSSASSTTNTTGSSTTGGSSSSGGSPLVLVSPLSVVVTSENDVNLGATHTFTVRLSAQPTADVAIPLSSSDTTEVITQPVRVSFTSQNWNSPQEVRLIGQDDFQDDDDQNVSIVLGPMISTDARFANQAGPTLPALNTDNDVAQIIIPPQPLFITEGAEAGFVTIGLGSQPTSNVTLQLVSTDLQEMVISPSQIVFSPSDWSTLKLITVTPADDNIADGTSNEYINIESLVTTDPKYLVLAANLPRIPINVQDNDSPGILVVAPDTVVGEDLSEAQFTMRLATQPSDNVVVTLESLDPTEGTVSPLQLTFTSSTFQAPQTVTVTGVNDFSDDGNIIFTVRVSSIQSNDLDYRFVQPPVMQFTNNDDDTADFVINMVDGPSVLTGEPNLDYRFTVALATQPLQSVTLTFDTNAPGEANIITQPLVFTTANWQTPQDVIVQGLDDLSVDPDSPYRVTSIITTGDPAYGQLAPITLNAINADNDIANIVVSALSSPSTTEGGASVTFTLNTTSQPVAAVTVPIVTNGECSTASPSVVLPSLSIAPVQVTVFATDDARADGTQNCTIELGAATSGDADYSGYDPTDLNLSVTDNDAAGLFVSITSIDTIEQGAAGSFNVRLTSEPLQPVTVTVASSNTGFVVVAPTPLTFNAINWNQNQAVTVTPGNDFIDDDDDRQYTITVSTTSNDSAYQNLSETIDGLHDDNDTKAFIVDQPSPPLQTSENLTGVNFTIRLGSQPTADVVVTFASNDTSEADAPGNITLNASNWLAGVPVTINGKNDDFADGPIGYNITMSAISLDGDYSNITTPTLVLSNLDNDTAGVTALPSPITVAEPGAAGVAVLVKLTALPQGNVVLQQILGSAEFSTSPTGNITLNSGNWNVGVSVTVTAVDDPTLEAQENHTLTFRVDPTGTTANEFDSVADTNVTVQITDDDDVDIVVTPVNVTISEAGTTGSFTVQLTRTPSASVTILLTSSDTTEATVPANVVLTNTTASTVTITPVNDTIIDGNQPWSIGLAVPTSTDTRYTAIDPADVGGGITTDNDKRTFRLTTSTTGNLKGAAATGVAGADALCNADASKPNTSTYKALIGATGVRTATPPVDWVLAPNASYHRTDGTTLIATTNASGLWGFDLLGSPLGVADQYWTGFTNGSWGLSANNCTLWTATTGNGEGGTGNVVNQNAIAKANTACTGTIYLLCIEQ